MPKKRVKKWKEYFFGFKQKSKCDTWSTYIFQGLFKNIVFITVALVTKKLWAILDFFFTD